MKPVYLEMKAFGPYPNKITIDFTKLYNSKVFLISGSTGSGKTSIFDAIFYALFNKTLASRDINTLKSDFNKYEEAYVKFKFCIDDKIYEIRRSPKQEINKKNKIIEISSKAELRFNDEIYTKIKEVDSKIQEIIGFTPEQFAKIILIPQGLSHELLFSSSSEKESIFRAMFKTQDYLDLQLKLKNKRGKYKSLMENKRAVLVSKLDSSMSEKDDNIKTLIDKYSYTDALEAIEDSYIKLKNKNTNDKKLIIELETNLENIKKDIKIKKEILFIEENLREIRIREEEINNLRTLVESFNKYRYIYELKNDISKIEIEIKETKDEIKKAKINISDIKIEFENIIKERKEKEKDYLSIEDKRNKLININKIKEKLIYLEKIIDKRNIFREELKTQKEIAEKSIKRLEKNKSLIIEITKNEENKKILEEENHAKEIKVNSIEDALKLLMKKRDLKSDLEILKNSILELEENKKKTTAYELSLSLVEGEPCIVCGSINHPNKAIKVNKKEEFNHDSLKKELERTNLDLSAIDGKLSIIIDDKNIKYSIEDLIKEKEILLEEINKNNTLISSLNIVENKESILGLINNDNEKYNISIGKIFAIKNEINSLDEDIIKAKKEVTIFKMEDIIEQENRLKEFIYTTTQTWEKLDISYNELKINLSSNNSKLKEHENFLNRINLEYEDKILKLSKYSNKIKFDDIKHIDKKEHAIYSQRIKEYDESILLNENRLNELNKDIDNNIEVEILEKKYNEYKNSYDILNQEYLKDSKVIYLVEDNIKSSKSILEEFLKYEKKYNLLNELYNLSDGKNSSNISFERFVLAMYLEEILETANMQLSRLSEGRYLFKRRIEASGGNRKEGLDIDVIDSYTLEKRDVKTLSGGEQFKAALSLALGIGDYVQGQNTSFKMEMLLIDEGFGTLSTDVLPVVIDTLLDVKDSGRLVGIISHVEEFKNYIQSSIQVIKTNSGSEVRVDI